MRRGPVVTCSTRPAGTDDAEQVLSPPMAAVK